MSPVYTTSDGTGKTVSKNITHPVKMSGNKVRQTDDWRLCIITPSHPANVHVTKTKYDEPNAHECQQQTCSRRAATTSLVYFTKLSFNYMEIGQTVGDKVLVPMIKMTTIF